MKKMILSILACIALEFGALLAWCDYHDILAAFLFICALVPSCLFGEGRQEYNQKRKEDARQN